jgi:hypothetical protein
LLRDKKNFHIATKKEILFFVKLINKPNPYLSLPIVWHRSRIPSFFKGYTHLAFQLNQKVNHMPPFSRRTKNIKFFLFIKEQQFNQTTKANQTNKKLQLARTPPILLFKIQFSKKKYFQKFAVKHHTHFS